MRSESKVGLVVIAFIAMVVFFSFKIGGDKLPWQKEKGYTIDVLFETIAGLESKSVVRYAGVEVGTVESIRLENGLAKVTIKLKPDIVIHQDAILEVGSMGLMGEKYVLVRGGTPGSPVLKPGDTIKGRTPVSMDQLINAVNNIGDDIKKITYSIREAIGVDQGMNRVESIVKNLDSLTGTLSKTADANDEDIARIIHSFSIISADLKNVIAANQTKIQGTMDGLHEVVSVLAETMPSIARDLQVVMADLKQTLDANQGNADTIMTNIASASNDLDQTMKKLKSTMGKIDSGQGTIGKLVNDDELHANLNQTVKDIDKTAVELRKLFGNVSDYKLFVGYHGEYLSRADDSKGYFSVRLQPRPDKFYLFELVSAPDGQYFEDRYSYTFDSEIPGYPKNIEFTRRRWEKNKITYSIQFGKTIRNFTFRGGLIESTAGFGMDYSLFRKKLILSFEGWDFGRETDPHFKIGGRVNFTDNFFITGGWDDFLLESDKQDNFYFGAGLRFADEDLKLLLGFFPLISGS